MSVARAREVIARLRSVGITVHEQSGWENRGNGQTSAYEGFEWHHTATGFANQNLSVLINGRPDLSGPLCNTCGWADGSVGMIAAHPANHAGASGGYNTAPLPVTSSFNKRVWGHEIIYPGTQPMTAEQYRTACILAKICVDVFGYSDINRAKGHAETSITGKWDPGYAPGRTMDLNKFRKDAQNSLFVPSARKEDEMGLQTFTFPPTGGAEVTHTFVVPVGDESALYSRAWISVKSANGPIRKVRLMAIASNQPESGTYPVDKTWTDVRNDRARVSISAGKPDNDPRLWKVDQFTAMVTSDHPYSITIETQPK